MEATVGSGEQNSRWEEESPGIGRRRDPDLRGGHRGVVPDGPQLSALVVNLITMEGPVGLNLYLRRDNLLPARFVATQIATADDPAGPTVWTIDVFDYGAAARYSPPTIEATAEATAESTP